MTPTDQEIFDTICTIVREITEEWNVEADIAGDTRLIAELGFTSMDVIDLLASLETKLGRKLPYEKLVVLEDGGYRQELTVADLTDFVYHNLEVTRDLPGAV